MRAKKNANIFDSLKNVSMAFVQRRVKCTVTKTNFSNLHASTKPFQKGRRPKSLRAQLPRPHKIIAQSCHSDRKSTHSPANLKAALARAKHRFVKSSTYRSPLRSGPPANSNKKKRRNKLERKINVPPFATKIGPTHPDPSQQVVAAAAASCPSFGERALHP